MTTLDTNSPASVDPGEVELPEVIEPESAETQTIAPDVIEPEPVASAALSESVLARAKDYGLSAGDLEGFDDARLERVFAAVDRRDMRSGEGPAQPFAGPFPGPPAAPSGAPMHAEYVPFAIEPGDDVDEAVVKPMRGLTEHVNHQLKQLHAFRGAMIGEMRAMNLLREFSDMDRFIDGLGDEWKDRYGSGATIDLEPRSNDFKTRWELSEGAKGILDRAGRGGRRLTLREALKRSHAALHWDQIAERERKTVEASLDKRRHASGERPGKGKAAAMSPRDEAIAAFTK